MKFINYKNIAFGIIIFFSIIGVAVFATTVHELSHWYDFKDYAIADEICVLNIPTSLEASWDAPMGYYRFLSDGSNETIVEKIESIGKHTETRAYTYTAIIYLIFGVMLFIVIYNKMEENER